MRDQPAADGAGADRDHDVVDRAAVVVLDLLDLVERELAEDEPAMRRDPAVERGPRRPAGWRARARRPRAGRERRGARARDARASVSAPGRAAEGGLVEVRQRAGQGAQHPQRVTRQPEHPPGEHLELARPAVAAPSRAPSGSSRPAGSHVEEDAHDLGAREPVDRRVMDLGQHRDQAALEPVDQIELPERPGAVERPGEDPRDLLGELLVGARAPAAPARGRGSRGRSPGRRPSRGSRARTAPRPAASASAAAAAGARRASRRGRAARACPPGAVDGSRTASPPT